MAEALILDSEALHALAHATERRVLADRARAVMQVAHERHALVRVPAPVLAEVCRGGRYDAAIHRVLAGRGIGVQDLSRGVAQRAGNFLRGLRFHWRTRSMPSWSRARWKGRPP